MMKSLLPNIRHLSIIAALPILASLTAFASAPYTGSSDPVTVSVSHPSGTYDNPIDVRITATPGTAQAFYSLKDDAYGDDTFLATWSIRIERSGPLYYFAYTDPTNESKILKASYVIRFPGSTKMQEGSKGQSGTLSLTIRNDGTAPLDLTNWTITSLGWQVEIPAQVLPASGETQTISIPYDGEGVVVLSDPNGDEREILTPAALNPAMQESKKPTVRKPTVTNRPSQGGTSYRQFKASNPPAVRQAEANTGMGLPDTAATVPSDSPTPTEPSTKTEPPVTTPVTVEQNPPAPTPAPATAEVSQPAPKVDNAEPPAIPNIKINTSESGTKEGTRNAFFALLALITIGILGRIIVELKKGKK